MVGPRQKKEAVKHVLAHGLCSLRRACKYFELYRSIYLYKPKEATEYRHELVARILVIPKKHSRYSNRRIRALLVHEGWLVSRKFVQKIRHVEGLGVPPASPATPQARPVYGFPDTGGAAQSCLELGLRGRSHRSR